MISLLLILRYWISTFLDFFFLGKEGEERVIIVSARWVFVSCWRGTPASAPEFLCQPAVLALMNLREGGEHASLSGFFAGPAHGCIVLLVP